MEELKKIGAEMNAQSNRLTQYPLFVIQVEKQIECSHYRAEYYSHVDEEYNELTDNELCKTCRETSHEENHIECSECNCEHILPVIDVKEFDLKAGVFLTAEACDDHIKANKYHYNKPQSYAVSAWRNPEMQTIVKFLSKLPNGEAKSCYKS